MNKREYRKRLKGLGYTVESFSVEVGLGDTTWHNWGEVPEKYVWWLELREARRDLDRILELSSRWRGR